MAEAGDLTKWVPLILILMRLSLSYQAVLSPDCRLALEGLLCRKDVVEKLTSSGKGFVEAVKFYLPKLLLGPIFHCANYFKYLEVIIDCSLIKLEVSSKGSCFVTSPFYSNFFNIDYTGSFKSRWVQSNSHHQAKPLCLRLYNLSERPSVFQVFQPLALRISLL